MTDYTIQHILIAVGIAAGAYWFLRSFYNDLQHKFSISNFKGWGLIFLTAVIFFYLISISSSFYGFTLTAILLVLIAKQREFFFKKHFLITFYFLTTAFYMGLISNDSFPDTSPFSLRLMLAWYFFVTSLAWLHNQYELLASYKKTEEVTDIMIGKQFLATFIIPQVLHFPVVVLITEFLK